MTDFNSLSADFDALSQGAKMDAAVERCAALIKTTEPDSHAGDIAFITRAGGILPLLDYQIESKARRAAIQQIRDAMTVKQLDAERKENSLVMFRRIGGHAKHRAGMTAQEKEEFGEMK